MDCRKSDISFGVDQRRSNALDTIRGIEDLADFFLGDDENGAESEGKYDDAEDENEAPLRTAVNEPSQADPVTRPPSKPSKYRRFRDRCMRAEFLDLSQGLPAAFEHDWIMVGPVPKGKRCLALSLNETSRPSCGGTLPTLFSSFLFEMSCEGVKKIIDVFPSPIFAPS